MRLLQNASESGENGMASLNSLSELRHGLVRQEDGERVVLVAELPTLAVLRSLA